MPAKRTANPRPQRAVKTRPSKAAQKASRRKKTRLKARKLEKSMKGFDRSQKSAAGFLNSRNAVVRSDVVKKLSFDLLKENYSSPEKVERSLPLFKKTLRDSHYSVRIESVRALARFGTKFEGHKWSLPEVQEKLFKQAISLVNGKAIKDSDRRVRLEATKALGTLGKNIKDPDKKILATRLLTRMAMDKTIDAELRAEAREMHNEVFTSILNSQMKATTPKSHKFTIKEVEEMLADGQKDWPRKK